MRCEIKLDKNIYMLLTFYFIVKTPMRKLADNTSLHNKDEFYKLMNELCIENNFGISRI